MADRLFTLDDANELIPRLEMEFKTIATSRQSADLAAAALGGPEIAAKVLVGEEPPEGKDAEAKQLQDSAAALQAGVRRVLGLGCTVKDLELGLVDFPSQLGERVVNLCWQFGEREVTHFHELDEGFASRRRLVQPEAEELRH